VEVIICAFDLELLEFGYHVCGQYSLTGSWVGVYPYNGGVLVLHLGSLLNNQIVSTVSPLLEVVALVYPLARAVDLLVVLIRTI
jgi:hypothetical protein